MILCGIDEAGRGPVIGPLVIAAACIDEKNNQKLKDIGVKDSKMLSPLQRERLFDDIIAMLHSYEIIIIPPQEIDNAVFSETLNLNWLEAIHSATLIDKLKPQKVIVDCPSNNIEAYSNYLTAKLTNKIPIIAEHKADQNHPTVAAASILAKVTRDAEIEKIKKKHNINFGSGYPSDPLTKQFLRQNWNKYDFFRKSWASYKEFSEKKAQSSLNSFTS